MELRQYLGDGVYVDYDGYHVILYTSDGMSNTNKIFLEPEVLIALERYTDELRKYIVERINAKCK